MGQNNEITTLEPESLLHGSDIASEWAFESITRAHALELIPDRLFAFLTFTDYTLDITRAEFAALAVAFYETKTGEEIAGRINFNDTDDINVQKMGYLEVVNGVGGGYFNPDGNLPREQAAVMLTRLAMVLQDDMLFMLPKIDMPYPSEVFTDYVQISSWAMDSVMWIRAHGIMRGIDDSNFAPQAKYTREQSIITILRLYDFISPWILQRAETMDMLEVTRRLLAEQVAEYMEVNFSTYRLLNVDVRSTYNPPGIAIATSISIEIEVSDEETIRQILEAVDNEFSSFWSRNGLFRDALLVNDISVKGLGGVGLGISFST